MSEYMDPETGEVLEGDGALVPLNLHGLDEDSLLEMFPSPVQTAGALLIARQRIAQAPAKLNELSAKVRIAKRNLIIAKGYAFRDAEGRTAEIRKHVAESSADVITAYEDLDTAELALEYGRELRKTLSEDIEILRSLNANFRGEHRR